MKKHLWVVKAVKDNVIEIYEKNMQENLKTISWDELRPKYVATKKKLSVHQELKEKNGLFYLKSKKMLFLFISLVIVFGISFGIYSFLNKEEPPKFNRYVEEIVDNDNTNNDTTKLRFRFNTTITVKKNTLQNINLENVNKDKNIQMKIKYNDDYIFDSGLIEYGKILKSEVLKKELPNGQYGNNKDVLAEIYTYDLKGNLSNQTNFNIKLIVQ